MATKTVTINPQGKPAPNPERAKGPDNPGGPDYIKFEVNGPNSFVLCFPPALFGGNNRRLEVCGNTTSDPLQVRAQNGTYQYKITICGDNGDCADCPQTNPAPCDPTPLIEEEDPPEMIID